MYPNHPQDSFAEHFDIAMRAIEGDVGHALVQSGVITLALTANTLKTDSVTFERIFTQDTIPHVTVSLSSIDNTNSIIKFLVASNPSNTGFTLQALSDTTQSITVTWIAKGQAV